MTLLEIPPSQLPEEYCQWRMTKNLRGHFWAPMNDKDCNLNAFTPKEKFFLRVYDRYNVTAPGSVRGAPYKFTDGFEAVPTNGSIDQNKPPRPDKVDEPSTKPRRRPTTASAASRAELAELASEKHLHSTELDYALKTREELMGARESKRIFVDIYTGHPVTFVEVPNGKNKTIRHPMIEVEPGKRVRIPHNRLREVSTSTVPDGYYAKRPFHQSYNYYKYYGFGGMGAKTSYAKRDGLASATRYDMITTDAGLHHGAAAQGKSATKSPHTESTAPRSAVADLLTGEELSKRALKTSVTAVRVAAHATPEEYVGTRPYTTTYEHYKYHGYAGQGAKTSWGHNPKLSKLNVL